MLERGRQYDPRRPFAGWLLGIARHLTLDAFRKTRLPSLDAPGARGKDPPPVREGSPSPLESLLARERRDRVATVTASLPPAYGEVLFLRFVEEMRLEEIARVTGLPLGTVKSRLYRALRHLAARLGGEP